MDTIYHLYKHDPTISARIHCVAGRGTYFVLRDRAFPPGFTERYWPFSTRTNADWFLDTLELYCDLGPGSEYKVLETMHQRGFLVGWLCLIHKPASSLARHEDKIVFRSDPLNV